MSESGTERTEVGTAPDCTFCDDVAKNALVALDGDSEVSIPVCPVHWEDYQEVVSHVQ